MLWKYDCIAAEKVDGDKSTRHRRRISQARFCALKDSDLMRCDMTDRDYMLRAIELAAKGLGYTNPNPLVGAVIVKDGRIIGEGYHEVYGSLHAERNAIKNLTESAQGADMYVTLEPCCHFGKQPPCTEAVISSGVKRVFVGSFDPNPKVAGKGTALLREAGIEVIEGFMREECDALNPVFFHYISTNEPYIALKYAMTADGKIATGTGKSQWITGEAARNHVHELRGIYKGILVGIGTVLADDPMLTCRIEGKRNPIRIVMDTNLRIPENCKLMTSVAADTPVIIVCGKDADPDKKNRLTEAGAEVISVELDGESVSVNEMLRELGARGIDGILVEGGGKVNASFVKAQKVNCVYTYLGAKIFGGEGKYSPVTGAGIDEVSEALELCAPEVKVFGDDVLLKYNVRELMPRM